MFFKVISYYQEAGQLPLTRRQQAQLYKTERNSYIREVNKYVFIAALVTSLSSVFFNFNPSKALVLTAISGIIFLLANREVNKSSIECQAIINNLRKN